MDIVRLINGVAIDGKFIRDFWKRVKRDPETGCWNWIYSTGSAGYGHFRRKDKFLKAHRVSWTLRNGEIPEGMCICHHCDNKKCVRPSHLFMGTHADNMADKKQKGRTNSHSMQGEKNPDAKLTKEQVIEIRKLYDGGGYTMMAISELYPVGKEQIRNIALRLKWKWLEEGSNG